MRSSTVVQRKPPSLDVVAIGQRLRKTPPSIYSWSCLNPISTWISSSKIAASFPHNKCQLTRPYSAFYLRIFGNPKRRATPMYHSGPSTSWVQIHSTKPRVNQSEAMHGALSICTYEGDHRKIQGKRRPASRSGEVPKPSVYPIN